MGADITVGGRVYYTLPRGGPETYVWSDGYIKFTQFLYDNGGITTKAYDVKTGKCLYSGGIGYPNSILTVRVIRTSGLRELNII